MIYRRDTPREHARSRPCSSAGHVVLARIISSPGPRLIFLAPSDATFASTRRASALARHARVAACDAPALPARLDPARRRTAADCAIGARAFAEVPPAVPRARGSARGCARRSACRSGPPGATARARTSFRQGQWGALAADIEIRSSADLTELLAHEFEHLIEQLDGVDLARSPRQGGEAHRLDGWRVRNRAGHCRRRRWPARSSDNSTRPRAQCRRIGLARAAPRRAEQRRGAVTDSKAQTATL